MCGIAGYISTQDTDVPVGIIQRMTDAVSHRGPDGQGIWQQGAVSLGHRRLSILDLSELGHQPMVEAESGIVISYNGEIYNYVELREELVVLGYRFHSNTDTEVVLKAYHCWGQACVEKFNGMWAFAIYDPQRNILFCSRDRFGVKPFYYAELAGGFAFGSEIRQLLPLLPRICADATVLVGFLVARVAEDPERSFFAGVRKLPGGHNLIFDLGKRSYVVQRYYSLKARVEYAALDLEGALETFRGLFRDAISLRLRSDVRVGTCLSGGMDSSSIATLASEAYRKESNQAFSAITAISEDPATDESQFARCIVESSSLDWITMTPSYEDFHGAVNEVVRAQEEPFASASVFMQFFVMREARRTGITVLLDGQGGDEALLGYDRYFADHLQQSLKGGKFAAAWHVVSGIYRNGRPGALRSMIWNLLYFHAPLLRRIATRDRQALFRREYDPLVRAVIGPSRASSGMFELQQQEIERNNLPALLRYEDKNSMAHSIETRLPFLDYRIVEFATSVATSVKLHDGWGKYLLRKSMEGKMPDEIVWRKLKFGFEAPESKWIHQHAEAIREAIDNSKLLSQLCYGEQLKEGISTLDHGFLWRLFSVAIWEHEFGVESLA